MTKLYFAKISRKYPQQHEHNFYAGGEKSNSWYGEIEVGDYVFPIFEAKISKLWKVKEYKVGFDRYNTISENGAVYFELIKEFNPVSKLQFVSYKNFEISLDLLNKIDKATASEKKGFFEIKKNDNCPSPEKIDFDEIRKFYITLEKRIDNINLKDKDICLFIDSKNNLNLTNIMIYKGDGFDEYLYLKDLYNEKNQNEKYSLKELLEYAKIDYAPQKEKYLTAVLEDINNKGFYEASNPIKLYDCVIVGRKKSAQSKKIEQNQKNDQNKDDKENDIFENEELNIYKELLNNNPNLILYGPPGTGKTYTAQKIIEHIENESIKTLYENGKVEFITFHQSFSYEEFVEGLRPVINENEDDNNLKYKVEDGIVKKLANKASLSEIKKDDNKDLFKNVNENSKIYKLSLGRRYVEEAVYEDCKKNNYICIGWLEKFNLKDKDYDFIFQELMKERNKDDPAPKNNANSIDVFVNQLSIGDIILIYESRSCIRDIVIIDDNYYYDQNDKLDNPHKRKVKWIKHFDVPYDIKKLNGNKVLTQKTIYELANIKFDDIKNMLTINDSQTKNDNNLDAYYLIIDEINRGNISKIFGELISLIESDKRENLSITLPYSQKPFSLPKNLFIIGTMNTADRSIAILDMALRRRFLFAEIEPDENVITNNNVKINRVDLEKLFTTLNIKITEKLDRDHRVGHSYFLDIFNLNGLRLTWYYKIIPLLMEYFYNQSDIIANIIGNDFFDKNNVNIKWINDDEQFERAIINIYEK